MEYRTHDLRFASVLVALGYSIVKLESSPTEKDRGRIAMIFEETENSIKSLDELKEDYYACKVNVDAMTLFTTMDSVKTRILACRNDAYDQNENRRPNGFPTGRYYTPYTPRKSGGFDNYI